MLKWLMAKKIREATIKEWLLQGNVAKLDEHWKHPEMIAYRARELVSTLYEKPHHNAWCNSFSSGKTLVFLLARDPLVQKAHKNVEQPEHWSNLFFHRCWRDSWALLDVGPAQLRQALALPTLDMLMRTGLAADGECESSNSVRAKIHGEVHGFYRAFQTRYPLTALAWIDNDHLWVFQRPMMANLMRHAASHHPEDVLGAYLIWALDVGLPEPQSEEDRLKSNAERMAQLLDLAGRVGLDTSGYKAHWEQCKTLYAGLGIELTGHSVGEYVRSVSVPAAPEIDHLDTFSLFS